MNLDVVPDPIVIGLCLALVALSIVGLDYVGRKFTEIREEELRADNAAQANRQVDGAEDIHIGGER